MDDMIGVPEREDARVIPIAAHPKFSDHTIPEIVIGGDEGYSETYEEPDGVDEAMIDILEEVGAAQAIEERNPIGNNVCWQCTHRIDARSWWKKTFLGADAASYECEASSRIGAVDPVTGQIQYIERIKDAMGTILALVDRQHRRCVDINPAGRCQMFSIAMAKKKKH